MHFVNDHVDDEEPTWVTEARANFSRNQIMEGIAQRLCLMCNASKTVNTKGSQGDSMSHESREAFLRNVQEKGHLLPAHVQQAYAHLLPSQKLVGSDDDEEDLDSDSEEEDDERKESSKKSKVSAAPAPSARAASSRSTRAPTWMKNYAFDSREKEV